MPHPSTAERYLSTAQRAARHRRRDRPAEWEKQLSRFNPKG